jgi:hypothetical protein
MSITKTDETFLRGLHGPKHWSEADARRVLALHASSGESRAAFVRRYSLRATRLVWWQRRLEGSAPVAMKSSTAITREDGFVRLVVGGGAPRVAATVRVGAVVVELAALDVAAASFVAELSRALGDDACC